MSTTAGRGSEVTWPGDNTGSGVKSTAMGRGSEATWPGNETKSGVVSTTVVRGSEGTWATVERGSEATCRTGGGVGLTAVGARGKSEASLDHLYFGGDRCVCF